MYRNVKVESMEVLDETLTTVKTKGFINYYGRFTKVALLATGAN